MSTYFFDANVQVKYLVAESGSTWVGQIQDDLDANGQSIHSIWISEISVVEVSAALAIIYRIGRIRRTTRDGALERYIRLLNNRYVVVPITSALLYNAARIAQKHPLKAYDAVQLAVGLELQTELDRGAIALTFVTGDKQLLAAAQAEGMATANPIDYAHLD